MYLRFIDEYTHYIWIYFLKTKSDVNQALLLFKIKGELQTRMKIKIAQYDEGGEFNSLNLVLASFGIVTHVSCPYIPQKKGLAKRQNRNIIEKGLALLTQGHVPIEFWNEYFH